MNKLKEGKVLYKSAVAGLFLLSISIVFNTSSVHAQSEDVAVSSLNIVGKVVSQESLNSLVEVKKIINQNVTPKPPQGPIEETYLVVEGDTLSSIATSHNSTWLRVFFKNTSISNPDSIKPGDSLIIPTATEQLSERPLPQIALPVAQAPLANTQARSTNTTPTSQPTPQSVISRNVGSTPGNLYSPGYCTWYVKNRRPDLPNNLGNADTWVALAVAQGLATGSQPSVGAVGQQGMHVVYVESVNGDGTVTISEMNYRGWNVTSQRTVSASSFRYIY